MNYEIFSNNWHGCQFCRKNWQPADLATMSTVIETVFDEPLTWSEVVASLAASLHPGDPKVLIS
jgi:hypothetical protein